MGNSMVQSSSSGSNSKSRKRNSKNNNNNNASISMFEFYDKIMSSNVGEQMLSCSFGSWCREKRLVCGFYDKANYTPSLLHNSGRASSMPDTTEGRFFQIHSRTQVELLICEKQSGYQAHFKIPRFSSPSLTAFLQNRHIRFSIRSLRAVAYHNGNLIVQVCSNKGTPFTKFYIFNLEAGVCTGHFLVCNVLNQQYEVHISPSATHIALRPDVQYIYPAVGGYQIQSMRSFPPSKTLDITKISTDLYYHGITYNKRLGDHHVLAAGRRLIKTYRTLDWVKVSEHRLDIEAATIHQIRSSPSGDFLAVRFTYPEDGCHYNHILIMNYPHFSKVMQVDVRGAYWPVSELINLKVFPRFSLSESCLAVMKQHNFGRKVFVYKLPVELRSLRDLCRRAVLHLVTSKDIAKLPIPSTVQKYLTQVL